jgi:nitrite reductase (NADH) large subunit
LNKRTKVLVIGGGILGLEAAFGIARKGIEVTVCEGAPYLLQRQLDERSARIVQEHLESKGLKFIFGDLPSELIGDETVRAVKLNSGRLIDASLVITSAGIRPNSLAEKESGLQVARGLVVDDEMKTSDPDIFGAGDGAEHRGNLYGVWPASMEMGRVAGLNACGNEAHMAPMAPNNLVKVLDFDVYSVGDFGGKEAGTRSEVDEPTAGKTYEKLVFSGGNLVGAILVGDGSRGGQLRKHIENKTDFTDILGKRMTSAELIRTIKEQNANGNRG